MDETMTRCLNAYAAAWTERDQKTRDELLGLGFAADGEYIDNNGRAVGRAELSTMIGKFLVDFPLGATMVIDSGIDEHDRFARFTWIAKGPDGEVILPGMDFAQFAESGQVQRIVGFFGPIPPQNT